MNPLKVSQVAKSAIKSAKLSDVLRTAVGMPPSLDFVKRVATDLGINPMQELNPQQQQMVMQYTQRGNAMTEQKISMSKSQFKGLITEAVIRHEKKKLVNRLIREQINEQIATRNLTNKLLSEGPLTNVWDKIKAAGSTLGGRVKDFAGAVTAGAGAAGQAFDQTRMAQQAQEQIRAAQQQITSAQKRVMQAKAKYTQEMLKNAETVNQYHDAVLSLYQTFQQLQPTIQNNPALINKLQNDVMSVIGQLHYDLSSEKEQIDSFLKHLGQQVEGDEGEVEGTVKTAGKKSKMSADEQRDEETYARPDFNIVRPQRGELTQVRPGALHVPQSSEMPPSIAGAAKEKSSKAGKKGKSKKK